MRWIADEGFGNGEPVPHDAGLAHCFDTRGSDTRSVAVAWDGRIVLPNLRWLEDPLTASEVAIHVDLVLLHTRLAVRIHTQQAAFHNRGNHQHLKELPQRMGIDLG